jgi:hypothetical protein
MKRDRIEQGPPVRHKVKTQSNVEKPAGAILAYSASLDYYEVWEGDKLVNGWVECNGEIPDDPIAWLDMAHAGVKAGLNAIKSVMLKRMAKRRDISMN